MGYFGGKSEATLCWTCQRAIRVEIEGIRCPWSHYFKPVPGWDAIPTKKYAHKTEGGYRCVDSYNVKSCPLYLKDKPQDINAWMKGVL